MSKRGTLSRPQIIETAARMVDRDGMASFSMRRLGGEMGVDPMAIYHHIPNRAALLRELVTCFLTALDIPEPREPWQDWVRAFGHDFRVAGQRHPGLFHVYSQSGDWSREYLDMEEALYSALARAGFTLQKRARAGRLLLAYLENFVHWELTGWVASNDAGERAQFAALLESGDLPEVSRLADHILDVDPDAEFTFGLDATIMGIEAMK